VGCSGALLLVIVIGIVLAVASGSGDDPTPTYSTSTAPTSTFSPSTSSTSAITTDFQGSWKGTGYQTRPRVAHWDVQITLVEGLHYATVRYPQCSGILQVVSSSVGELVFRQTITTGRDECAATGYVTLSSPGSTSVRFEYSDVEDAASPNATGTLFKQ